MKRAIVFAAAASVLLLARQANAQAQYGYRNPYYYSAPYQYPASSYNAFSYPYQPNYATAAMGYGSPALYGYGSAPITYVMPQATCQQAPVVSAPVGQPTAMLVSRPAGQPMPTLPAPLPPGEPIKTPAAASTPAPDAVEQGPALETGPACGEPDPSCAPACPPQACPQAGCDKNDPRFVPVLSFGFDDWRGISDTDYQDNFGIRAGINLGFGLFDKWGIGGQLGASNGAYDFDGRDSGPEPSAVQSQVFLTGGLFKRADKGWPFTVAVVYDWMINDNFGVNADEPSFGQLRGLISMPLGCKNDIGLWGTLRTNSSTQDGTTYEAVNQYNVFWKHWFPCGSDATVYVGMTDNSRHGLGGGSLGSWIVGGSFHVPLCDHWAVFGDVTYMRPSAPLGNGDASFQNSYNVSVGFAFYPCTCLRQRSSCNRGWLPVLPVANNGSFLVNSPLTN